LSRKSKTREELYVYSKLIDLCVSPLKIARTDGVTTGSCVSCDVDNSDSERHSEQAALPVVDLYVATGHGVQDPSFACVYPIAQAGLKVTIIRLSKTLASSVILKVQSLPNDVKK
jgi:hypothetical protein